MNSIVCPKCNSTNVRVDVISSTSSQKKKRGAVYWLLIGWWLEAILWFFLTIPRLLIAVFHQRTQVVTNHDTIAICQSCAHTFSPPQSGGAVDVLSADRVRVWEYALVASLFFGFLGVDRFYLGDNTGGLLKLLTLGLFGVLWVYDIYKITTKSWLGVRWKTLK